MNFSKLFVIVGVLCAWCMASAADETLLARAKTHELPTVWEPIPEDEILHHTAGFAKTLCSGVFITGLSEEDAAANIGGFSAPFEHRHRVVKRDVDQVRKRVSLTLDTGQVRTAQMYESQGCVTHPLDHDGVHFTPSTVKPRLPDPETTNWPMGERIDHGALLDPDVRQNIEHAAADPAGRLLGFVATHRGQIVAETYGPGISHDTPLESWSMGKSLTGTLMAVLIQQGAYELWQDAPIPEWTPETHPDIRIGDIMRMSSGIRIRAPQDPEFDPSLGYPDHLYFYTGPNAFEWAATRPREWPANTIGRYRNSDPVLTNYLIRLAVEARGENYHAFPQRNLFDKLGIRNLVMETDAHGNFLTQGYEFGSARDWARIGNLYLRDGVWNGERLLPEGYVDYTFTPAPAWVADGRPVYGGGFLWLDLGLDLDVEYGAFAGAGGQFTVIIPSHDLVVARLGKYTGAEAALPSLGRAIKLLIEAVEK